MAHGGGFVWGKALARTLARQDVLRRTLTKVKGLSQAGLAKTIGISREAIGKYERGEASASVETAKKIADAFDVTLDHLVDETTAGTFDKKTVQRIQELQTLPEEEQRHVFAMVDAFLRDARARTAYALG